MVVFKMFSLKNYFLKRPQIQSLKIVSFFHNIIIEINFSVSFLFYFSFSTFSLYILNSTVRLFFKIIFSTQISCQRLYTFYERGGFILFVFLDKTKINFLIRFRGGALDYF